MAQNSLDAEPTAVIRQEDEYLVDQQLTVQSIMKFLKNRDFPAGNAVKLGVGLGLPSGKVDQFRKENSDLENTLIAVISYWLQNDSAKSWDKLAGGLRFCDCNNMADEIQERRAPIINGGQRIRTEERLPFLTLESGQEEEQRTKLVIESGDIKEEFAVLVARTVEALKIKNVNVKELRLMIKHLPFRKQQHSKNKLLQTLNCLQNADITEALDEVSNYWSFFDYKLLGIVIKIYNRALIVEFDAYVCNFTRYCEKRLVSEVPIDAFAAKKEHPHKVKVKLDEIFDVPLEDVKRTKENLSVILDTSLNLVGFEEGCIELTFICMHELDAIFPLSAEQKRMIKIMVKILKIYSDNEVYYEQEMTTDQHQVLQRDREDSNSGHDDVVIKFKDPHKEEPTDTFDSLWLSVDIRGENKLNIKIYGKWMVFRDLDCLGKTWRMIKAAILARNLGGCLTALCSTVCYNPSVFGPGPRTQGVVCVCTEEHNVDDIGYTLIELVQQDIEHRIGAEAHVKPVRDNIIRNSKLYWNRGKPSLEQVDPLCHGTTRNKKDFWYVNIVKGPEPLCFKEDHGRWIIVTEYKKLTELWHIFKKEVEAEDFGVIEMSCPPKKDRTSKPVFHLYTNYKYKDEVGQRLIQVMKKDVQYEHKHGKPKFETLYWNNGEPAYERMKVVRNAESLRCEEDRVSWIIGLKQEDLWNQLKKQVKSGNFGAIKIEYSPTDIGTNFPLKLPVIYINTSYKNKDKVAEGKSMRGTEYHHKKGELDNGEYRLCESQPKRSYS